MPEPQLKIYQNSQRVAETLAEDFFNFMEKKARNKELSYVVLSGGSTPQIFFNLLAENYSDKIDWENVHFFWADERCVPWDHEDSNYGMAKKLLFDRIEIPLDRIHPIHGHKDFISEAERYAEEIQKHVPLVYNLPRFDWVWLGMGEDGHTASIFPDQLALMHTDRICETSIHPVTKQKRITLTGKALNNARRISFLVTGKNKADMVKTVLKEPGINSRYPAAHIRPFEGVLEWYLDEDAIIGLA